MNNKYPKLLNQKVAYRYMEEIVMTLENQKLSGHIYFINENGDLCRVKYLKQMKGCVENE